MFGLLMIVFGFIKEDADAGVKFGKLTAQDKWKEFFNNGNKKR
jgi:hypothetical protein